MAQLEIKGNYREETMEKGIIYDEIDFNRYLCADKVQLILGDDFEVKVEDRKTFVVRKKPQYPNTYEECYDVLGMTYDYSDIRMMSIDEFSIYTDFITLIRCRNAYWKIAGEQMKLSKPWEPDWSTHNDYKYSLYVTENNVTKGTFNNDNVILAFPTEEMRDVFYENFKELIEKCKKLL